MKLEEFNYHLPKGLIAQFPCQRRDESRLMVLNRKDGTITDKRFFELTDHLKPGDVIVLNNTKVIPARLFGRKTTGGLVEVLLVQRLEIRNEKLENLPPASRIPYPTSQTWSCLISPARGLQKGLEITFEYGLKAVMVEKTCGGSWLIELHGDLEIDRAMELAGNMPLPPYIKRGKGGRPLDAAGGSEELDRERYQTVFAKEKGAIAAPTAGLHFTNELLEKIQNLGAEILYITLHTGLGTFKPVKTEDITKHRMDPEYFKIDPVTFEIIKRAKQGNRRIIAVGSTVTRTLETMVNPPSPMGTDLKSVPKGGMGGFGWERPILSGATNLFIYPGCKFNIVDALITNFHLPKSTLLMLAAAFAGKDFLMAAYDEAVKKGYRFYSYGDAMMIM